MKAGGFYDVKKQFSLKQKKNSYPCTSRTHCLDRDIVIIISIIREVKDIFLLAKTEQKINKIIINPFSNTAKRISTLFKQLPGHRFIFFHLIFYVLKICIVIICSKWNL